MRHTIRVAASSLAMTLALSACGGGGSTGSGARVASSAALPSQAIPSGLMVPWNSAMIQKTTYVGPLSNDFAMTIRVEPALHDEAGLLTYAREANDPHSSLYRQFLTPQQIGQRFGASATDMATIAKYFNSFGLSVATWPQQLLVEVHGKRSAMEKALGTTFGTYQSGTHRFVAPLAGSVPHFQQQLPIRSAILNSDVALNRSYLVRIGAAAFAGYSPQQLAHGFDYTGAWNQKLTGAGITVGIIGTGPIDTSPNGDVPAMQKAYNEIAQFGLPSTGTTLTLVPAVAQTPSPVNNNTGTAPFDGPGLATPPPVTAPCGNATSSVFPTATCNPEDGEAQLDTESVAGLAPNAAIKFFLAFNNQDCVNNTSCPTGAIGEQGLALTDDEIQQAISDDTADVLSLSYGLGEVDAQTAGYFTTAGVGLGPDEFAALAAEGIAVFASSGDNGNDSACTNLSTGVPLNTPCVSYPASDPSVVAVGGVNIPLDPLGNLTGQITAWADQTTGGGDGTFGNNVGSGGGLSAFFATPAFQQGLTAGNSSAQLNGKRGVPDIALDADGLTGPSIVENAEFSGTFAPVGGTSAAAPEAAAMWALVLQACNATASCATATGTKPYRLGNPNALFYAIAASGKNGLSYKQVFYDVLYGENQAKGAGTGASPTPGPPIAGCCTAGPGYDLVTGLGAPFAGHLIQAVTGTNVP